MTCGCFIAILRVAMPANNGFLLERWLQLMTWIVMLIHHTTLVTESVSTARYLIGLRGCLSCVVAALLLIVEQGTSEEFEKSTEALLVMAKMNQGIMGISILIILSLPRRSRIFRDGKAIDGEGSSSVLGRLSFHWVSELVALAEARRRVTLDDLPELDDRTRAGTLQEEFFQAACKGASPRWDEKSLFRLLLLSHGKCLRNQIILSLPLALLAFTPQLALWRMLQLLEEQSARQSETASLAGWALVCGLTIGFSAWLENWLLWLAMNKISVPLTQQLTAILYNKAISHSQLAGDRLSEQNLTNLISMDTQRIATVAGFLYSNVLQAMKLIVASTLLAHLLGWQSLLAGLSTLLVITPLHRICLQRYGAAERALTGLRDSKMAALTEALQCIRQVKIAALERKWEAKINQLLERGLQEHRTAFHWYLMNLACHLVGPVLVSATAIGIYTWIHGSLTPSVAFPALSLLGYIQFILGLIPDLWSGIVGARISLRRMGSFLQPEKMPSTIMSGERIEFHGATIGYESSEGAQGPGSLRDVTTSFPPKELSIITGATGMGKSLMLRTILGECRIQSGILRRPIPASYDEIYGEAATTQQRWVIDHAVAFVPQLPWHEAATIRQNILFGLPLEPGRYRSVLHACALTQDLEHLEHGDLTDIGSNGCKLSGGQKARVALARALYSRAGILLLDDIFSAVDIHTARHIFRHALTGDLAEGRTRILVTHHVQLCAPKTKYLVSLDNGTVAFAGTPSQGVDEPPEGNDDSPGHGDKHQIQTANSTPATHTNDPLMAGDITTENASFALGEDDRSRKNLVRRGILRQYIQTSGGWRPWAVVAGCYISYNGLLLVLYSWVRLWTESGSSTKPDARRMGYYTLGYIIIACTACVLGTLRSYLVFDVSLQAARELFHQTIHALLRAQIQWLESVPTGSLINLFASDFYLIDSRLGLDLIGLFSAAMDCVGVIMGAILVCPALTIIAAVLLCAVIWYTKRYVVAVCEIKHLEAATRGIVYEHFNMSSHGLSTIHAFCRTEDYTSMMHAKIDQQAKTSWYLYLLNRWLTFRINVLGTLFSLFTLFFVVRSPSITGSFAGFALVFTNHLCHALVMLSRTYATAEMDFSAVERAMEYTEVPTEPSGGGNAPDGWPAEGRLCVRSLTVAYSPEASPVLHNITFAVEPGQRIGVVGRTGAGKSSLALALLRCLEAREGAILIDGIDISTIKLHHLRRRLAMIPQNPILFTGTVRSNLDPFDQYSDDALTRALKRVSWESPETLHALVSDGGSNLSCGERQILCLARAMLSDPAVLVMDEATSAMDHGTDQLIQRSIRSQMGERNPTLIVIAHRLQTIVDFDRVLVLHEGRAVEFGSPQDLMQSRQGLFRQLVDDDVDKETLYDHMNRADSYTP
ncbi:P-loop containing nucleoside triphosphate hydrolase protein [Aspergillus pseudotamarii]|uniref:P-loop containing nucleoside triphosphate hydrolase protein n=1 Tax=Aspergillus pseudotamarii TaxID=132259 RepID=A0A5N6TAY2_ASPPS|nr:P-loop containing nucleoside triphosphate hydrolase protein [Aspergillus pseudotamarii]KAE8143534.1 P-loop containing nucleoside triphosphate hydrolase protein [Aspergillus pseudotamarii]